MNKPHNPYKQFLKDIHPELIDQFKHFPNRKKIIKGDNDE